MSWSIIWSICLVIHPSIHPIIHLFYHGLFTPTRQRKSGIQMQHGENSNRKRWHTCQSPTIISIHQELNQLQKELTPSPLAFLPFLLFRFSASVRRALASSSSFSSIPFQILASSRLINSFASLLASTSYVRRCCFNFFTPLLFPTSTKCNQLTYKAVQGQRCAKNSHHLNKKHWNHIGWQGNDFPPTISSICLTMLLQWNKLSKFSIQRICMFAFEVVNQTLRDLMQLDDARQLKKSLVGTLWSLVGIFDKSCLLFPKEDKKTMNASLPWLHLWQHVTIFHLHINMRVMATNSKEQQEFLKWVLNVRNGSLPTIAEEGVDLDWIKIPSHMKLLTKNYS